MGDCRDNSTNDKTDACNSEVEPGMAERFSGETTLTESKPAGQFPVIGGYRIIREIGSGGMGIVYEAEQQNPKRLVALKVIRGGRFVDEHQIKLFAREAQALARLKHPGIAAIYESGRTPEGQHFFAMELVRGETLETYIQKSLESQATTARVLRERLAIFRKISDAITYAHQRGVIHRDLKPSNIIVHHEFNAVSSGSEPNVPGIKILDFGLARITEMDLAVATVGTEIGKIEGTLPYMSPEQVRGNGDEIDVRSDVYSLGVILYEMITGRRPYELRDAMLHEAARIICETPPEPLSKSWSGTGRLDRDLETIVGKALEKETPRRYQSVLALGEDVSRFLTGQPILARPPSVVYQLRKMAIRHKLGFTFSATLLVLIAAFSIGMLIQARHVARERDRANHEAARANLEAAAAVQVADFLTGLFRISDPAEARGRAITARELLDKGAARIQTELARDPALQARLLFTIGDVYRNLGVLDKAEQLLSESADIRQRVLGPEAPDTLLAYGRLGIIYDLEGKTDLAEKMLTSVLEKQRRTLGESHPDTLKTFAGLANLYDTQGRYEKAFTSMQQVFALRRKALGPDHLDTLGSEYNLAVGLYRRQDFARAEALLKELILSFSRVAGSDHPYTLMAKDLLGSVYLETNRLGEARRIREDAYQTRSRVLGPDHMDTLASKLGLANVAQKEKRLAEAEGLYWEILSAQIRVLGPENPDTLDTRASLATLLSDAERFDESERLWRDTLNGMQRILGPGHPDTANCLVGLAVIEMHHGRGDSALHLLEQAMSVNPVKTPRLVAEAPVLKALKTVPEFEKLFSAGGSR